MNIQTLRLPVADLRQLGFGLIELMIAMTIGLFLIAGVGYVFVSSKTSYNTLEALSRIQENARYAFDYMGEDIRMAGFSGGPESSCTDVVSTPPSDSNLKELCTPDPYSPPPYGPLIGYDDEDGTFPSGLTPLGGDAITVVHADVDQEYSLTAYDGTSTFTLGACPTSNPPDPGDILVAADYTHAAVFQVDTASGCPTGGTVTHTPTGAGVLGAFGGDIGARKLYPVRAATYYIDTNPAGEPALYRRELTTDSGAPSMRATEIIEGVEDMQIEYGEDTVVETPDDLNEVTVYRKADAVGNWTKVLSVRIMLSMVSASDTRLVPSDDGLLHKTITSTIAVRNRLQ